MIGANTDVVVSTVVSISRNLKGYIFPNKGSQSSGALIINKINTAMDKINSGHNYYRIREILNLDAVFCYEKGYISKKLIENKTTGGFITIGEHSTILIINEEDHLKIRSFLPSYNIMKTYELSKDLENKLSKELSFAKDEQFGYLTCNPTNSGTGLKVGVTLHLPAYSKFKNIELINNELKKHGFILKDRFEDDENNFGNMFILTNECTFHSSEDDILEASRIFSEQIIDREIAVRKELMKNKSDDVKDLIMRNFGFLKYCHRINSQEALEALSIISLGVNIGIIKGMEQFEIMSTMDNVQTASIQKFIGRDLKKQFRDVYRAKYIKDKISCMEVV